MDNKTKVTTYRHVKLAYQRGQTMHLKNINTLDIMPGIFYKGQIWPIVDPYIKRMRAFARADFFLSPTCHFSSLSNVITTYEQNLNIDIQTM